MQECKIYAIEDCACDNEKWQSRVNGIFKQISKNNLYALDWNHSCYEYNPQNNPTTDLVWSVLEPFGNKLSQTNYYFTDYYSNGGYHLFVSKDISYGIVGKPGFGEKKI